MPKDEENPRGQNRVPRVSYETLAPGPILGKLSSSEEDMGKTKPQQRQRKDAKKILREQSRYPTAKMDALEKKQGEITPTRLAGMLSLPTLTL